MDPATMHHNGRNSYVCFPCKKSGARRNKLKQYGLTLESFDELLASQGGGCLLCLRTDQHLHVDHDHQTGEVRGLLCTHCNAQIVGRIERVDGMLDRLNNYLRGDAIVYV